MFSLVFGLVAVIYNDSQAILDKGFFQGYTPTVAVIIFLQVLGRPQNSVSKNQNFKFKG
jgi:hypothetical protein